MTFGRELNPSPKVRHVVYPFVICQLVYQTGKRCVKGV